MTVGMLAELDLPVFEPGTVWLVGAGPGDPGLLTLHALNALRQADVVVHDALIGPGILALLPSAVERIFVGKRGGKPSPKQPDISRHLIELAQAGRRVLRLKGGDPFVFGRGGEEAMALAEAGIPFRVVPGVSAGIGGLAYAGIPITHRESGEAVTFVTGHSITGAVPDTLDWAALAKGTQVLVLYMGLKHIGIITRRLMDGGRNPDEPVAVIANATLPEQRVLVTTLARATQDVADSGIEPPAMIVVGSVVNLHAVLGPALSTAAAQR